MTTNGVVANDEGVLTLEELDAAVITALLAEQGVGKGQYKRVISETVGKGAYYIDFCTHPGFIGKSVSAMKQSVKNNLDELSKDPKFPKCKIASSDDKLLVINLDVHAERTAAKQES